MKRETYLGTRLYVDNFLTAFARAICGIVLIALKSLLGVDITWRLILIPSSIVFWVGITLCLASVFMFISMEKIQSICIRCKKGLIEGEAAFSDEVTDFIWPILSVLSTATPASLTPLLSLRPWIMAEYRRIITVYVLSCLQNRRRANGQGSVAELSKPQKNCGRRIGANTCISLQLSRANTKIE